MVEKKAKGSIRNQWTVPCSIFLVRPEPNHNMLLLEWL
jgi:hypothetical protein